MKNKSNDLKNFSARKNCLGGLCMDKVFHIYAKDKCLYYNLNEEEFNSTWKTLSQLVELLSVDGIRKEDLSYECLARDKEYLNSSY